MTAALSLPTADDSAGWSARLAGAARYANWAMAVIAVLGLVGWNLRVPALAGFGTAAPVLPSEAAMLLAGAVALAALHGAGSRRAREGAWTLAAFIAIVATFGLLRSMGVAVEVGLFSLGDPPGAERSSAAAPIYLLFASALAFAPRGPQAGRRLSHGLALVLAAICLFDLAAWAVHGPNPRVAPPAIVGLLAGALSLLALHPSPLLLQRLAAMGARWSGGASPAVPAAAWLEPTLACLVDAVITADRDGRVMLVNRAAEKLLGLAPGTAVGRRVAELLQLEDDATGQPMACPLDAVLAQQPTGLDEAEPVLLLPGGERLAVEICAHPIRAADATLSGGVLVLREVGERRTRDRALRESAALMDTFAACTPELIIAKDHAGRITLMNPAALHALGLTREQVIGRSKMELYGESEETRHIFECDQQVMETGQSVAVEEHLMTPSGRRSFLVTKSPLRDTHGRIFGVVGVATDITQRKQAQEALEQLLLDEHRLRDEAERANRAKDEFLAIVSHELRSPLNALKGWSHVLSSGGNPDMLLVNRAVQAIKRNVDQQTRLIDDLLDTSRIVSGKLTLEFCAMDLVEVVRAAMDQSRDAAQAKHIELRFKTDLPEVTVKGDPGRLQQVVLNLLSNAIKFTTEEGVVDIALVRSNEHVELAVSDNGIGIDAAFLPHVFERFSQADSSTTRRHWGLGIGLALVRHLVELHGGTVRAVSPGTGRGSTFTIELPVPMEQGSHAEVALTEGPQHPGEVLAGIRVMLVDDDLDAREALQFALQHAGAEVYGFASGASLLHLLANTPQPPTPTALVLDIAMPGEDGFSVLTQVRALPCVPFMPAIAVTALTYLDRHHFEQAGFQDCLGKPLDPYRLVKAIVTLMRRAAAQGEDERGRLAS